MLLYSPLLPPSKILTTPRILKTGQIALQRLRDNNSNGAARPTHVNQNQGNTHTHTPGSLTVTAPWLAGWLAWFKSLTAIMSADWRSIGRLIGLSHATRHVRARVRAGVLSACAAVRAMTSHDTTS